MASGADVKGVEQLNATLKGLIQKASGSNLETAVLAGLLPISNAAKEIVHKVSGNLARSIHNEASSSGNTAEGRSGTNAEYAAAEEFRPGGDHAYMRPAYDKKKKAALQEVADVLEELTRP